MDKEYVTTEVVLEGLTGDKAIKAARICRHLDNLVNVGLGRPRKVCPDPETCIEPVRWYDCPEAETEHLQKSSGVRDWSKDWYRLTLTRGMFSDIQLMVLASRHPAKRFYSEFLQEISDKNVAIRPVETFSCGSDGVEDNGTY